MIKVKKKEDKLLLIYRSESGLDWIDKRFQEDEDESVTVAIKRTFHINRDSPFVRAVDAESALSEEDATYEVTIGFKEGDYFKIDQSILQTKSCFYIDANQKLEIRHFVVRSKVSVLKKIDGFIDSDKVYIGDKDSDDLPFAEFERFKKVFPNKYEIERYIDARVDSVLSNYFDTNENHEEKYSSYLKKKLKLKPFETTSIDNKELELSKLIYVKNELEEMLRDSNNYVEKVWQNKIIKLLTFLMPKYIHVIDEVPFDDPYNQTQRSLDFLLIDYLGNIDLIEIKKPSGISLMSKGTYRNNHFPLRDLSGSIMQIEKYIYYLNKGGIGGEDKMKDYLRTKRNVNTEINIVNPRGIVILGRDESMNKRQKEDFEIVKRQYKNIADIITYDDFLQRLKTSINQLRSS